MRDKIKRVVIALLTVAPFVGTVIWNTVDWFLGGMKVPWWQATFKSTEVLTGILVSVVLLLATFIYYVQHLVALKRLPDLERKLDKVERTGVEAVQTATGFIERAFGLQVMTELRDKYHDSLLESLQALGFNLRNWENHVTKKQDGKILLIDDSKKIAVWLRYMRTYYFEEAFDIRRKVLVTNGRNFCFLLLATLQAFLEKLDADETLYYYAVTPVHPKDWYNWPHGYFKPRAYFEEDFMGLFYRTLREILKSKQAKQKVTHGRFILTADNVPKDAQRFGWALDDYKDVQEHLKTTWMLPVSVPIKTLQDARCNVLKSFHNYYNWLIGRFPTRPSDVDRLVVPLFCHSWKWDIVASWFDNKISEVLPADQDTWRQKKQETKDAWAILSKCNSSADGKELVGLAEKFHKKQLNDSLNRLIPPDCPRCKDINKQINSYTHKILNNNVIEVPDFIQQVHHYSVLLSEHDERDKQENLKFLLQSALRLRDCQLVPSTPPVPWPSLGKVFIQNLHSSPKECCLVKLNRSQMENWYNSSVKPEFTFFGVKATGDLEPTWKLILATDLDYPFEVGKIRIIEPGDPDWEAYKDIATKLIRRESFTFCQIQVEPQK